MTVYLSGSYLDLRKNIYKKEAEYYLQWGNKHRWRKKSFDQDCLGPTRCFSSSDLQVL